MHKCPGKCGGRRHFANAECDAKPLPTIGSYSQKPYKCTHCGDVEHTGTNHWGDIYSSCKNCSWKRPMEATVKVCLETPPPGYGLPTPWEIVSLADAIAPMTVPLRPSAGEFSLDGRQR